MATHHHPDLWKLFRQMLHSRVFEELVRGLWVAGRISGEMHLAIGEEAICAGVVDHLKEGDALALDHRGTPPLLMRGVAPGALLYEFMGRPDGLCKGMGGHMHLFSPEHLAASSGIVGASGPAGAGFALAGQLLRPGSVSVAFFGEGAMNQGMLLESLNLAAAWRLPVIFVCKDNRWAITTRSDTVTSGDLLQRVRSFDIPAEGVNGADVEAVWQAAGNAIQKARKGKGPHFLIANCVRPEGHFLGDGLLRLVRRPLGQARQISGPLVRSVTRWRGASIAKRVGSIKTITGLVAKTKMDSRWRRHDPLEILRRRLNMKKSTLSDMATVVHRSLSSMVEGALAETVSIGDTTRQD